MFERALLLHYHEIGLKGRNRLSFENRLRVNVRAATRGLTDARVERVASRFLVPVTDPAAREALIAACAATPGVVHVSDAIVCSREVHDLRSAAELALREVVGAAPEGSLRTFAVDARRSATDHPVTSLEMNRDIGAHLRETSGLTVRLNDPDVRVRVEVVQGGAYVSARRVDGPGGLPVGVSGRVVGLLSAGIDSPVAIWRMIKRGAVAVAVHFTGAPDVPDTSTRDVHDIASALEPAMGIGRVYSIPIGDLQREIMLACPPDLRILLYRRLMLRVSEFVARTEGARALVTGESLGQVASQTLDNIVAVDAAVSMPVFRPLIGTDKLEIIAEARRLGTYDISIREHSDCCTLHVPRTPATHATVEDLDAAEAPIDIVAMALEAMGRATTRDFRCTAYRPPAASGGAAGRE